MENNFDDLDKELIAQVVENSLEGNWKINCIIRTRHRTLVIFKESGIIKKTESETSNKP